MKMTRLQSLLANARKGLGPWQPTPENALANIGTQLQDADFPDILLMLDKLAIERDAVERERPWDGDAADDVHFAQQAIFQILTNATAIAPQKIVTGLRSAHRSTRFWIASALANMPNESILPELNCAMAAETCENNRNVLKSAITRVGRQRS